MIDYQDFIIRSGLNVRPQGNKLRANCPFCGDRKSRLWFIRTDDGNYIVHCFNDGCVLTKATNLLKFLEKYNNSLYEELRELEKRKYFEFFKSNKENGYKRKDYNNTINQKDVDKSIKFVKVDKLNKNIFKPIDSNNKALEYCKSRKVEENIYKHWYYVPENSNTDFDNSILMPFLNMKDNTLTGFSSRNIDKKSFIINLFSDNAYKIYNLYNVDTSKPVYIFESIFDSLCVENSIALCGASFPQELLDNEYIKYPVFCFDYDKTGLNRSIEYLHNNYNVFIIPSKFQSKLGSKIDMNEVVVNNNLNKDDIEKIILSNIYYKSDIVKVLSLLRKNRWALSDNTKGMMKI